MSDKSSYAMVLKDTCDACGCATGWTGGSGSMDPPTEWDTVASQVVSSTSPNWDFGAREAGVWKITAFPEPGGVIHGGAFGDGVQTSNSGDLHWNSGGVTLDNTGMRDRSYLGQFYRYGFLSFGGGSSSMWPVGYRIGLGDDHTKYSSAVQIAQILAELGKIGANGHNPSKNIPKLNTWGHGFNFSPPYSSFHSTWHGWGTHTTHPFSPFANFAQFDMGFYGGQPTHIIQPVGAIFVWVSGLNEYALPADVLTASASYPDNYDDGLGGIYKSEFALHEGFRRHILPHTDGGTIAGSISDVTDGSGLHWTTYPPIWTYGGTEGGEANRGEDLTGEKWRVRLHKLATTTDTLWLSNEYNKGVKSIRFKRWSNHIGPSSHPGSWVFPLWSFDAELDRVAVPNMSACHHSLFKADLQAPFTWAPEHYLNALKHDGSSEIVARDRSLLNWDQGIVAPSDSTDGAAAAEASSGESFADGSYWIDNIARKVYTFDGSSWTLHPLPPANGMVRQNWKLHPGGWRPFSGYYPSRYSTDLSWVGWTATPIFEDDTLGEELRLEGNGAGYGVPSYAAQYIGGGRRGVGNQYVWLGQRPASRVHNSSKGGVPFCYNLGHLNPNDPQIIAGGNPTDPADEAVRIY